TSDVFADSFELAIQSSTGGVALVASGRSAGRPHGRWSATRRSELRMQVVGAGKDDLESIASALARLFEEAGFMPEMHWEPPSAPKLGSPAVSRILPLSLRMTERERAEVSSLGKMFSNALRAGGRFTYRDREEWDACEWADGAFVWTCGGEQETKDALPWR